MTISTTVILFIWFALWAVFTTAVSIFFITGCRCLQKDEPLFWILLSLVVYQGLTTAIVFNYLLNGGYR